MHTPRTAQAPRRRRRLAPAALVATAALLTLSACEADGSGEQGADPTTTLGADPAAGTTDATAQTGGATAYPPDQAVGSQAPAVPGARSALSDEQVIDTLTALDAALQAGDVDAFLGQVAPELAEQQRAWFEAVLAVPMDVRQLRLDGVVSRNSPEGTVTHIGLRHQITGADPMPVLEQYRWVFAEDGEGRIRLVDSRGRNGQNYGYPQVWDLGEPVAVLESHNILVLAPESHREAAEELLPTLDLAAERSLATLPWLGEGRERVAVHLGGAELLEEATGLPDVTYGEQAMKLSPEEIPMEPGPLTGALSPISGRLLLDADFVTEDIDTFGLSAGGDTTFRALLAESGLWGDQVTWPPDWLPYGVSQWWALTDDEFFAEEMRVWVADHHATAGPATELPVRGPTGRATTVEDEDAFISGALSFTLFVDETYGQDSLVTLVDRLAALDQRHDRDEIAEETRSVLGVDEEQLLSDWQLWSQDMADELGGQGSGVDGR